MIHLDSSDKSLSSGVGLGKCEFPLEAASGEEDEFSLSVSAMILSCTSKKLLPLSS